MKHWFSLFSLLLVSTASVAELSPQRQSELHNKLVQDCGSCHGLQFKGGLGPALLPGDLQGKPREFLLQTILQGRPATAMPPWNAQLSREEAEWMLDQLIRGIDTLTKP